MLSEKIKEETKGLYYLSESDYPVELFEGGNVERITSEIVAEKISRLKNTRTATPETTEVSDLRELSVEEFFAKLTRVRDGAGEREVEYARRFEKLRRLLESNLQDIKVYKTGQYSVDIYIVGLDRDNNLTGVHTQATET